MQYLLFHSQDLGLIFFSNSTYETSLDGQVSLLERLGLKIFCAKVGLLDLNKKIMEKKFFPFSFLVDDKI